jgi:hypothetical protein
MKNQIFQNHFEAFQANQIKVFPDPNERKFQTKEQIKEALESGEIIPSLVRSTIDHVLTPWQQIEVYSGLGFPSFGTSKAKFEKAFLMVLNNFGIK